MFNSQPGDVFGCVADLGWMAGHTCVVYGPLCNGETTVLFEGLPWEPHPGKVSVAEKIMGNSHPLCA